MLEFRTHGKWILAGEHSVIRGGEALVFPVQSRFLDFRFIEGPEMKLNIRHENSDLELAFWGVFEKALQALNLNRSDVSGSIELESNIPVGAGMGASATLCVSLARWLSKLGHLAVEKQFDFARDLENLFHGKSSGVDVAVALSKSPLLFKAPSMIENFEPLWQPHFYLSYCGKRGVTSDCIKKVTSLIETDPTLGKEVDGQMQKSVEMAKEALMTKDHLSLMKDAIDLANSCFEKWGLISHDLGKHISLLKSQGAIAAKPTGSGDGGFVLSLWQEPPTSPKAIELIQA